MLSIIYGPSTSVKVVLCLLLLYSTVSFAQEQKISSIDIDVAIQAKKLYNKKIIRRETVNLSDFGYISSHSSLLSKNSAIKDLKILSSYDLLGDTLISIRGDSNELSVLFDEKFDELKYDENFFLESYALTNSINSVSIFTDIYRNVRVLFIKLKDIQYCIID